MYYGSGTVEHPCSETVTSHALGGLAGSSERRADVIAAILKVWRHIKNPLCQSMAIYLKNNGAKFNPDQIWNYGDF